MIITKEAVEGMREIIDNWDKLTDDTQYSIVGLSEYMGTEKAIELFTGLSLIRDISENSQTSLDEVGLGSMPKNFIKMIKEIAEA